MTTLRPSKTMGWYSDTWHAVRQRTLSSDYLRSVRALLLELQDILSQQWDDLWLCRLDPWSPASHLPYTCQLCGACDMVSSAVPASTNSFAQCSEVVLCPWPEPSPGPRRRTEGDALQRHIEGAETSLHGPAGPAGAALLWTHVHLGDPMSVAHLSHVFMP